MAAVELTVTSGRDPERVFLDLAAGLEPSAGDLALVGQLIRADIREKTAAGLDVDGASFAPYKTDRPYYYNASSAGGKFAAGSESSIRAAAKRLHGKLEAKDRAGQLSGTRRTVKFESYDAFKEAFGRDNVDLQGVAAPHMLDAIVVRVNGQDVAEGESVSGKADEVVVGIFDSRAAAIASGHTTDERPKGMPKRRFFGVSKEARERSVELLRERILLRTRR